MASTNILGRVVTFTDGTNPVAGIRVKNFKVDGTPIDVTDDDDAGWQRFLETPPKQGIVISGSGLLKDKTLLDSIATGNGVATLSAYTLDTTFGSWAGDWIVHDFSLGVEYDKEVTFSATFSSNGALTYTAAA